MIKSTNVAELKQWLDHGQAVLVDVREADEYAAGHIAEAVLLPLSEFTPDALPPHDGKKLVMQCKSGGRSRTACGKVNHEFPNLDVYNLEGGITAWMQAGYPCIK